MSKFFVGVKEVWEVTYRVEAENEKDAVSKVSSFLENGNEDIVVEVLDDFGFCKTLPEDDWAIYSEQEDKL